MNFVKGALAAMAVCGIIATGHAQDTTMRVPDEQLNLRQCVDIAIKNNLTLRTSQLTLETDRALYQQAIGNMLPNVGLTVNHQEYTGKSINPYTYSYVSQSQLTASYSLSAYVTLWAGSSLQHFLKQNREAYQAGGFDVQQAKDNLTITIILDYLSVLSAQEQLKAAMVQDSATREQVRVYAARNQQGSINPGDYFTLKGQLSQNDVTVATAVNTLETAKVALSKDMNVQYSSSISLVPVGDTAASSPYGASIEDMYAYSIVHLPLIESVDLKEQSARNGLKGAKGTLLPVLYLTGGMNTNYSNLAQGETYVNTTQENTQQYVTVGGSTYDVYVSQKNYQPNTLRYGYQLSNNINYSLGLQLSVPILNGFSARTRVRNARITEESTRFNQSTARLQLRQAIATDYINMTSAYKSYMALQQAVSDYGAAYSAALARLDAGVITSYEFVGAKNSLDGATLNLIGAKYNYILQSKILDYYMGRLTL